MWKNNIEEIPRDPFQILQQNEALASRQLNSGDPLSPRSAIVPEKQSGSRPSKSFSSDGQKYPDAHSARNVMSELMAMTFRPCWVEGRVNKTFACRCKEPTFRKLYHSKPFPPYPVSSYDLDGGILWPLDYKCHCITTNNMLSTQATWAHLYAVQWYRSVPGAHQVPNRGDDDFKSSGWNSSKNNLKEWIFFHCKYTIVYWSISKKKSHYKKVFVRYILLV